MKLVTLAALALLPLETPVRFETEGVRVGNALVRGSVLELAAAEAGPVLASGSSLETLASSLDVDLGGGRTLVLEPGVRVTRVAEGFRFSAHQNRRLRFVNAGEAFVVETPALMAVTREGWTVASRKMGGDTLRAGLQGQQDETDTNLQKMKESAERMRSGAAQKASARPVRVFRVNPLDAGAAVSSVVIRLITQVTPSGAP